MTRSQRPTQSPSAPSFEQSLTELESIVDALERGDMSLEDSLGAFERGITLTRACQKVLDAAEQRVRILTEPHVDAEPEPFDTSVGGPR